MSAGVKERNTPGMSKPFLSDRNQAREGRTRDFSTAVMSENCLWWGKCTVCPVQYGSLSPHVAIEHSQCAGGGLYGEIVSQPFLTAWMCFPCLPDVQESLCQLLVFFFFFRVNCFIYSCSLRVSVGGGEFRIFLCGHLKPEPSAAVSKCHCPAFWPP